MLIWIRQIWQKVFIDIPIVLSDLCWENPSKKSGFFFHYTIRWISVIPSKVNKQSLQNEINEYSYN